MATKGIRCSDRNLQELVNLMRLADNLKNSYQKQVTVQVKVINGVKYYGLILGSFLPAKGRRFSRRT